MGDPPDLSLCKKKSRIVEGFSPLRRIDRWSPDHGGNAVARGSYVFDRLHALPDKIIKLKKIKRWVAANRQFGENHKIGMPGLCHPDRFQDTGSIVIKIPDAVIQLCQRYLHDPIRTGNPGSTPRNSGNFFH